ncbi:hypothetical protein HY768_08445 [candidate division TA06 bacterium]|uniref:MvaI/BcnI restriction endonuclease domain-containing protein n=1 Tax=candidate division TA06 bacterium TaxID=2250710 RepID=A0A933MIL5_UNCT6|nr:hypothetical protein [candidate division TA06 bacterium]
MTLQEITRRLITLNERGFISSLRKGSTGVGHTFEHEMGLQETNIPVPDIGGRVEIKTTRRESKSLITLFCFNRGVWQITPRQLIERYGYLDEKGRRALKNTIFLGGESSQGLNLRTNENNTISLVDRSGNILAIWDVFILVGKLMTKLTRVLFVIADRRYNEGHEEFHYNEAMILTEPQHRNFIEAFNAGIVGIDLRMHLKENGAVRNRGTAFRIREIDMINLYSNVRKLEI